LSPGSGDTAGTVSPQDESASTEYSPQEPHPARKLLENYYLPGELEARIGAFVAHYNYLRYHESLGNLTPADVYFGRGHTILIEPERIKKTDHRVGLRIPSEPVNHEGNVAATDFFNSLLILLCHKLAIG